MHLGQHISGQYQTVPFCGIVSRIDPNWEYGSRNAANVLVELDSPITVDGESRERVLLLGLDPERGCRFDKSRVDAGSFLIEADALNGRR